MIMEIYAMESGLLRAMKYIRSKGEKKAAYHAAAVKVYANDAITQIVHLGRQVLAFVEEGEALISQMTHIDKLGTYRPIDTVSLRRLIAEKVLKGRKYPF